MQCGSRRMWWNQPQKIKHVWISKLIFDTQERCGLIHHPKWELPETSGLSHCGINLEHWVVSFSFHFSIITVAQTTKQRPQWTSHRPQSQWQSNFQKYKGEQKHLYQSCNGQQTVITRCCDHWQSSSPVGHSSTRLITTTVFIRWNMCRVTQRSTSESTRATWGSVCL